MMVKLGVVVAVGWSLLGCSEPTNYIAGDSVQNPTQSASTQPPNIVLIMADDLGYGDISPYGGWIKTPNLKQLAQTGVQFSDFHASGNVCSPTRAGLMTGLYQQRLGIPGVLFADPARPEHYAGIAAAHTTIAEVLQQHGYATAIFGKWHLGYQAQPNATRLR